MASKKKVDKALKPADAKSELGSSGSHVNTGFEYEEFLPQLRGSRAIRKYREMRDNDAIVGAVLFAIDMLLRAVEWRVDPSDESEAAATEAEFVESLFDDMSHTFEDFISEVLSFLPYGFSFHEVVYKSRSGPEQSDPKKRSKFTDGLIGIRKIAPRAQWTLERFEMDENGGVAAFIQHSGAKRARIPIEKGLLFRTISSNNNPHGRSVLRNAYKSYWYLSNIENYEAIAIERELNGLPVGRIPSEYLRSTANPEQKAFVAAFETILRDVKLNEQGYILLPSDMYADEEGKLTDKRQVDFELMTSNGKRAIDTGKVIMRYQSNIARTVLADFVTLGQSDRGSFALSKSKADLFLKALEGYLNSIAAIINRHLIPRVWALNGKNFNLMPTVFPGDVAPIDLEELGDYIQKISGAGAPIFPSEELTNTLLTSAGLPEQDESDDPDLLGRTVVPEENDDDDDDDGVPE